MSERASRGRFSRLVICDVPEIRERVVEKPVATLLARTRAFEIARSRRLGSEPGLYKRVGVRVRAREREICEGIESHKPEAFHGSTRYFRLNVNDKSGTSMRGRIDAPPDGRWLTGAVKVLD